MAEHRFTQVDVFGDAPLGGNPVAVVHDAEGIADAEMAALARWTNLSETTFLLPPATAGADYRLRIFTPYGELPFAGHPTLGSCHAWLQAGAEVTGDRMVQECRAGLIELRCREDGTLAFASPPLRRYEPADEATTEEVARGLGLEPDELEAVQWVDNGPGWVAALLGSAADVRALSPRYSELKIGAVGPSGAGEDTAFEVRAFFPKDGAVVEDPVTGSLNASLAHWLTDTGRAITPYVARQGTALQRTGCVHVDRDGDGTIWVGGATTTVFGGSAWID